MKNYYEHEPEPSSKHTGTKLLCDFNVSIYVNDLQLEVSRKQTLNLSTHLAVFELLAYWLQVGNKYHTAKLR